jgi:PAB1-binding protein PBP1
MDLLTVSPENRLRQELADSRKTINQRLEQKDKQIHELMQFKAEMKALLSDPKKLAEMLQE